MCLGLVVLKADSGIQQRCLLGVASLQEMIKVSLHWRLRDDLKREPSLGCDMNRRD